MGFSVFLSMPFVFKKNTNARNLVFYNSFAAGILIFLLMDVYSDVQTIFNQSSNITYQLIFILFFALAYLLFYYFSSMKNLKNNAKFASFLAALGIGTQNLTEGLLFGSSAALGLNSVWILTLVGFSLQNATEGFPIAAPLMFENAKMDKKFVSMVFFLGAIPTVIGTVIGMYYNSNLFIVFFDAIACAAIVYVILMMIGKNFGRKSKESHHPQLDFYQLTYLGILFGFVLAYLVNYIF